jgi:hypothetical protein
MPQLAAQPLSPEQRNLASDQERHHELRKAEMRPWGFKGALPSAEFPEGLEPNHDSKLGKLGHVFAMMGNIAGDIVAPGTMANIPGTQMNRQVQEGRLAKRINTEQTLEGENEARAATTAKTKEETAEMPGKTIDIRNLTQSEIEKNQAEIYGLKNPWAKLPEHEPLNNWKDINQAMLDRYRIRNPQAQALPPELELHPNAQGVVEKGDFDRIDKMLNGIETAGAGADKREDTKAQREITNQMRAQTYALALMNSQNAQAARNENQSIKQLKWVQGHDAEGNAVAGPLSQAEKEGWENLAELPPSELKDMMQARRMVKLATKVGDPKEPASMGTLQLIDSLDKDGKLGIAASRINRFLAKGVGSEPGDDPRIMALLDKSDLYSTGIMKYHFGASGGRSPLMLQHFVQMADAGKMDGPTLKAGTKAMLDYMRDGAMEPGGRGAQTFTDGGKTFNIPPDKVAEFKKDHPNAR